MIQLETITPLLSDLPRPQRLHSSKIGEKQITTFPCGHQLSNEFIQRKMPDLDLQTDPCPVCTQSIENIRTSESLLEETPSGIYWLADYFRSFLCSGNGQYQLY
ncbi:MAG: hypothetical protein V4492_07780 [Chlamydiota bacterium]